MIEEQKPTPTRKKITETMKEQEQWYKDAKEVRAESLHFFINHLINDYEHDYGTICHAIAAASIAAAHAVNRSSSEGGITGFQAGAVMWEFIQHWGVFPSNALLKIQDQSDMLYPQNVGKFTTISKSTWKELQKRANNKLAFTTKDEVHEEVSDHWQSIADGEVPFGYSIEED